MLHLRRSLNAFNRQPDVSMNLAYTNGFAIFRIDFVLPQLAQKSVRNFTGIGTGRLHFYFGCVYIYPVVDSRRRK